MKLQTLQILQIFIECRIVVGGASVHISKHSLFRPKITVGCRLCAYPSLTSTYPSIHPSPDEDTLKFTVGCRLCTGFCVVWCGVCCVRVCSLLFSPLFRRSLLCSLSVTMTMITRPVGSLCVLTALTCESVGVRVLWPIPCRPNMFASCKKQLSWYNCASLVPLGMEWACICAGKWVMCL